MWPKCLVTLFRTAAKNIQNTVRLYMRTGREKVPKDLLTPLTVTMTRTYRKRKYSKPGKNHQKGENTEKDTYNIYTT